MSLFVIIEKSFEYNDEIHSPPNSGGGHPVMAFGNEEEANKFCKDRNFKRFLEEWPELNGYFYEVSDFFDEEAEALLKKYNLVSSRESYRGKAVYEWAAEPGSWQTIPPEDLQKIYDGCNTSWYEVYEVEDRTSK